ncbi:hypothetical protein [Hyalangium sp.]|uniref:hypothetical protein n=1 Tax=Hyalangium sp. TaxID=2028555 RepID=UPI002D3E78B1|nr:hypothetical protein [Hyalangium sp.]HYH99761.1 hypothetical protein [Hyalangium sp.]
MTSRPPVQQRSGPRGHPRGQSMVEYVAFSAAVLGVGTVGWPYLAMMLNALSRYFESLYYVIQSPLT